MVLRAALALLAAGSVLAPAGAGAQVERYAVVVGNDLGQPPDLPLRFAEADAVHVAAVLQEVGGVPAENLVLVRGQDAGALRRALIAVNERIRSAPGQSVLFVYYSGHADAAALHLGQSTLELRELEGLVRGSAATFRLLVLDACRSGALTRVKGGAQIPPFEIRLEERLAGEGAVVLTSSSASEDSQESEELRGSFFTHALVSGLLGAADEDGDGQVTLDEAYRHAYASTLRATSRTLAGLQHPTFQYEVRGAGDLVLSTLQARSATRAWIELPPGKAWLLFHGSAEGPVAGEVALADGARRLSVRPGRYFLRGRGAQVLLEGPLEAPAGGVVPVDEGRLTRTAYARLVRKGGGGLAGLSLELEGRVRGPLATDRRPCPGLAVGAAVALRRVTLSQRVAWCRSGFDGPGIRAVTDQVDLELSAGHVWDLGPVSVEVAVTAGASILHQGFRTAGAAPPRSTAALQLSPSLGLARELTDRSYLFASASAAAWLYRSQDAATGRTTLGPSLAPRLALGTGVRF